MPSWLAVPESCVFLMVSNFIKRLADFLIGQPFLCQFRFVYGRGLQMRKGEESQGSEEWAGCPAEEEAWRALNNSISPYIAEKSRNNIAQS